MANIFLNWESEIPKSKITHVMPRINILDIYTKQKQIKELTFFPKTKAYTFVRMISKRSASAFELHSSAWRLQIKYILLETHTCTTLYWVGKSPLCSHHSHLLPFPLSVSPYCAICLFVSHSVPLYKQFVLLSLSLSLSLSWTFFSPKSVSFECFHSRWKRTILAQQNWAQQETIHLVPHMLDTRTS